MIEAEEQGERLTPDEVIANTILLFAAGFETTTNLIGNGIYALLTHPEQLRMLQADPSLIPGAVEEFLRHNGPVQFTNRVALEDVQLGGKTIRRGQFVFLFLAAADRDPAHFPDPDRLDVTRAAHKHLAFGLGHHFCLGAPLARLEAQIAFATVLRRHQRIVQAARPLLLDRHGPDGGHLDLVLCEGRPRQRHRRSQRQPRQDGAAPQLSV